MDVGNQVANSGHLECQPYGVRAWISSVSVPIFIDTDGSIKPVNPSDIQIMSESKFEHMEKCAGIDGLHSIVLVQDGKPVTENKQVSFNDWPERPVMEGH